MTILKPPLGRIRNRLSQKIVIDWSMTILKQPLENVIDWSMTIFARIGNGLSQKIVIDRSMTILKQPSKNVIDWSMTVSHNSWVITENCH